MLDLESRRVNVAVRDVGTTWVIAALVVAGLLLHSPPVAFLPSVASDATPARAEKPDPTVVVEARR